MFIENDPYLTGKVLARDSEAFELVLEGMVDEQGMQEVLLRLMDVCYGKAAHLRDNWGDECNGRRWEMLAEALADFDVDKEMGV